MKKKKITARRPTAEDLKKRGILPLIDYRRSAAPSPTTGAILAVDASFHDPVPSVLLLLYVSCVFFYFLFDFFF